MGLVYLPPFTNKKKVNVGKYTSPMDPIYGLLTCFFPPTKPQKYPASAAYLDQGNIAWRRSRPMEVISMSSRRGPMFFFRKVTRQTLVGTDVWLEKKTNRKNTQCVVYLPTLGYFCGKCSEIYHTSSVWENTHTHTFFVGKKTYPAWTQKVRIGEYVVEFSQQNPYIQNICSESGRVATSSHRKNDPIILWRCHFYYG